MAQFEGTVEEFMKFIGGYARNKVQYITTGYRKSKGKCEECGYRGKNLQAAHLHGKERPVIMNEILNEINQSKSGGMVKVDLQEFEERFIEAHTPVESAIRILCRDCHRKYDEKPQLSIEDEDLGETLQQEDEDDMQKLVSLDAEHRLQKSKARRIAEVHLNVNLKKENVVYSNINKAREVWWLEPTFEVITQGFYMLLNSLQPQRLLVFYIPAGVIEHPEKEFAQRTDKGEVAKFIIPVSDKEYVDKKGFDFTPYLVETIAYD